MSPVILAIAQVLGGDRYKKCMLTTSFSPEMRTLAYIMMFNLFPMKNLMNLFHPRALFLHDLFLKKDIGIHAHIYHLLAKCIIPVIQESSLPYEKKMSPVILVIAQVLGGDRYKKCLLTTSFSPEMRTLAYIMMFNLFPMKNLMNLFHPRALFLHDLFLKKDIGIHAHIYHLLAKCVSKRMSQMILPFPGLSRSIMQHERV
nr:hypothetical protein CFP56_47344 [Quercus suber]